jgi:hypothetical protein
MNDDQLEMLRRALDLMNVVVPGPCHATSRWTRTTPAERLEDCGCSSNGALCPNLVRCKRGLEPWNKYAVEELRKLNYKV